MSQNQSERRKQARRSGKERRTQVRWDLDSPLRRKGPGRRVRDRQVRKPEPKH